MIRTYSTHGEKRYAYRLESQNERNRYEDRDTNGRIIFK
jgi:hypothetical protein